MKNMKLNQFIMLIFGFNTDGDGNPSALRSVATGRRGMTVYFYLTNTLVFNWDGNHNQFAFCASWLYYGRYEIRCRTC